MFLTINVDYRPSNIKWMLSIMDTKCVFCEIVSVIYMTVSRHRVKQLLVISNEHNKRGKRSQGLCVTFSLFVLKVCSGIS